MIAFEVRCFGLISRASSSARRRWPGLSAQALICGFLAAGFVTGFGPVRADAADASAPKDVTFDDIKLELKPNEAFKSTLLTPAVKKLDGAAIRIRGYILPSFQQTGLKQFVLVRDNMQCCFGPGAALHDCILVEMAPGATADFTVRPVTVSGTFAIREVNGPDGECLAIYHLDGKQVK